MIKKVLNTIDKHKMIREGDKIVLGVSGGADSVCLFTILAELKKELNIQLCVVHIHHGIRGADADADEQFVRKLCEKWDVWYQAYYFNVPHLAAERGMSEEEMGRELRYHAFEKVREEQKADKIAVAHHADDSVETILHNLCRGTGIRGMCGILPVRDNIIRPLIACSRREIETYMKQKDICYRTDATNSETDYTRNKIRLELIPYLREQINERSVEHIQRLAEQLLGIEQYLAGQVKEGYCRCVEEKPEEIRIRILEIVRYPEILQQEIIRACIRHMTGNIKNISAEHIGSIIELMKKNTGKEVHLPYGLVCEKEYDYCKIKMGRLQEEPGDSFQTEVCSEGEYYLPNGDRFLFKFEKTVNFEEKMYTKWFDYDKIKNVMQIRFRKSGDYLKVTENGHKKLKAFFIDEKVPGEIRDRIPLLADGSHIIWIVGYRISEEYKITSATTKVLMVQYVERDDKENGR